MFYYTNYFFRKFLNKPKFVYAIIDYELDIYKKIEEDNIEDRKYFIKFVYNIDYREEAPLLQYLFEHGISPDISLPNSYTLLHLTVSTIYNSTDEVKFLLHFGADPNKRVNNQTSIENAFLNYERDSDNPIYAETIRLLLEYGGDYTEHENNLIVQEFLAENREIKRVGEIYVGDNLNTIIASYHSKNVRMQFEKTDKCVIS